MNNYDLSDLGPPVSNPSFGNKAAILGKGVVAGAAGSVPDFLSLIYNLPAMFQNYQSQQLQQFQQSHPEQAAQMAQHYGQQIPIPEDLPLIPSVTEGVEQGIDTATSGYTQTPENMRHLYEGAKFTGSLAGMGGGAKALEKIGGKGIQKVLEKLGTLNPYELAAGVPTGAVMSAMSEEQGPLAGLLGGAGAGVVTAQGLKGLVGGAKGLKGTFTGKGPSLGEMTIGKALSKIGTPSQEIENIAKKYGFDLPFNTRLQSGTANFLANGILSTVLKSQRYAKQIENAPKQVVDALVKKIDTISPKNLGKAVTSHDYAEHLKSDKKFVRENYKEMREDAFSEIPENADMELTNLVTSLKDLRDELTVWVPSDTRKFVLSRINKLAEGLGVIQPPKGVLKFSDGDYEDPKLYAKVLGALEKEGIPKANIHKTKNQLSSLQEDLRKVNTEDIRSLLGRPINALKQDFKAIPNENFVNKMNAADKYYAMESANRVKSDLANALTNKRFPKEAYDFMSDPRKIEKLKHIIGDSVQGKQIFNSLKRAKLQDAVLDKVVDSDGSLKYDAFTRLFTKGNANQDLLKSLLGNDSYKKMQELTELSKLFSKSAKQFQNFSGTTKMAADLGKLYGGAKGLLNIFTGGGASLLGSSVAATGVPFVLSRLVSNPRYVDAAVKFGLAVKNGHPQQATQYNKTMKTIFYDTMRREAIPLVNKEKEQKQRDK